MPLIETRGLTKLYRMGDSIVRALDGVNLVIERGEFVAITGASGSGKSTMMHLLGCLDRPTEGQYLLDGRDVSDRSDRELADIRNRYIGFVFQTFNLINRTTAWENVAVPLFYARRTGLKEPALAALQRVGLEQRATHAPNELSGGERQRVAIARAIVNDPVLLMADEPTGNLDTRTGEQIMEIFRALNAQGVTIVMVTHEPDIARLAGRIVQMRDGKIVTDLPGAQALPEAASAPERRARVDVLAAIPTTEPIPPTTPPPVVAPVRGRMMRGATPALVTGLLAAGLMLAGFGGQVAIALTMRGFQQLKPDGTPNIPPVGVMVGGAGICVALLACIVLGIVAIVCGINARRRIRTEPGEWRGEGRALLGAILGWIAVGVPVVLTIVGLALQVMRQKHG